MTPEVQVLVIGAGPAGLTMAAELARYGIKTRIVEKAAARTDKSKALVVWSRTLELLDRAGCSRSFVAAGHQVVAANIVAGSKTIGHISLAGVDSPYPYALMLPQSDTERLLEDHLAGLGVTVEREVEAASFVQDESGVSVTLRHPDEHEEILRTGWLIGCEGAHSLVRETLKLAFEGDTLPSEWILADLELAGVPFPASEMALYWHEDGLLALFPITSVRYRLVANVEGSGAEHPPAPSLADVQKVIETRGPRGMTASNPIWLSSFRINERKVRDYRTGRVFVAGDAAHIHSPAGGQGMNTGMQDAINLAWKLALVCRGEAANHLLDSYSAERSAVGKQVLIESGRLTSVGVMKNHAGQALRNLVAGLLLGLTPVRDAMANDLSEIAVGYADSPINGPQHGKAEFAPGKRLAPKHQGPPIGAGALPRFAVFAPSNAEVLALIHQHPDLVEAAPRPPLESDAILLVRPDGYIAGGSGDVQTISEYLTALRR